MDPIQAFIDFLFTTGIGQMLQEPLAGAIQAFFLAIGFLLIYLGLKGIEPLLMIGIGLGMILANVPGVHLMAIPKPGEPLPMLYALKSFILDTEIGPILIFLGLGAMTDFRPLIAQPYTLLLGAAAQLGVVVAMIGALHIGEIGTALGIPLPKFELHEAAAIGIIGGADGPTTIYVASKIAPAIIGPLAISVYSYMAAVPLIQPPIIRLLPKKHRAVKMSMPRKVSDLEALLFPILLLIVSALLVPSSAPIIGALAFGNILRECGIIEVVERLAKTAANELMNILTILVTISVGSTMSYDYIVAIVDSDPSAIMNFLAKTAFIFIWGLLAFATSTLGGIFLGEVLYFITKGKINPMIGAAGVSAVPMSARVVQREAIRVDPSNIIIMQAMGPNIAGVIGTATVAGIYIDFVHRFYKAFGYYPWIG